MLIGFVLLAVAMLGGFPVHAQDFPSKPIRLVMPFPVGGSTDVVARTVAPRRADILGQPVFIDNRAGAGGNIGAEIVAKAAADGYTILLAASTMARAPAAVANATRETS